MSVGKITTASFDTDVVKAKGPIIIDFWAEWCAPCLRLAPVFEEISDEMGGTFAKVDIDAEQELAAKLSINSIPTLIVFEDGEEKGRVTGSAPKEAMVKRIQDILDQD